MSEQLNMFDEVKMEATEKKYKPLYEVNESDIPNEENQEVDNKPSEKEVDEYINMNEQQEFENESDLYDDPEEEMYEGVDGVLYPASEWFSPIITNGPTREEVEDWKRKYKRIYYLPFDEGIYIFRALKRPEYKEIIRNVDLSALDREEMFAERCVLFPRDFTIEKANEGDAGVVSVLSDAIMEKSGFMAKTGIIKL